LRPAAPPLHDRIRIRIPPLRTADKTETVGRVETADMVAAERALRRAARQRRLPGAR
jgi:hypothetical protein